MAELLAVAVRRAMNQDGAEVPSAPPESPYGYTPGLASCVAFVVVFSLLTIVHLGLAIRYKYAVAIATMVAGGILEIVGWAGRLWSYKNVLIWDNFIMQICCLILGPVFFSAWDYTLLGLCIRRLGPQYSLIGPNLYLIIFIIADIVSLVLQAIGGGGAAVNAENYEDTTTNTNIMLAGILFQLGTTTIFVVLAIDFMVRVMWNKPYPARWRNLCVRRKNRKNDQSDASPGRDVDTAATGAGSVTTATDLEEAAGDKEGKAVRGGEHGGRDPWLRKSQFLLLGVAWATLMIYIRGIYRSIELAEGWSGRIITTESYFIWLDGFMMVLCMAGLAVAHPGWLLPPRTWRRSNL